MRAGPNRRGRPAGFTLIELGIVIVIIGILVGFILTVGGQGVRSAEIRATQSLIAKIDAGLTDLIEQIVNNRVDPNGAHQYLAAIPNLNQNAGLGTGVPGMIVDADGARAQVIANADNLRALIPDVWFYQSTVPEYPINCGATPYDPLQSLNDSTAYTSPYSAFWLPMGNQTTPRFNANLAAGSATGDAFFNANNVLVAAQPTGIFGATFGVRGGLTKNLGYYAIGYDGQDNNNNGFIDELAEGTNGDSNLQAQIQSRLILHQHATARSEMLYAVLVEGLSPYGSALNRDDFTTKEVQDTDGDGMPEFIDAWGQPLQFYLWPTGYTSDIQKGLHPYSSGSSEPREQAPLDPDQQLMAPAWWANNASSGYPLPPSSSSAAFSNLFFPLFEVNPAGSAMPGNSIVWDRQFLYPNRRAYYTKPLIVSSGPDQTLGLYYMPTQQVQTLASSPGQLARYLHGQYVPTGTGQFVTGESWAVPLTVPSGVNTAPPFTPVPNTGLGNTDGDDDLANQKIFTPGGGIQ